MSETPTATKRTLPIVYGLEGHLLVITVGDRRHVICAVQGPAHEAVLLDEMTRWLTMAVSNAASELADRMRSPAFAASVRAPRTGPAPAPFIDGE